MSEEAEQPDGDDEESSGRSGKKIGLIIIIVVVLLGGGLGAAYFFGMLDGLLGKTEEHAEEEHGEEGHGEKHAEEGHGEEGEHGEHGEGGPKEAKITYYKLEPFTVNLSSTTSQTSLAKITVSLELPSEEDKLIVEEKLPLLRDHFNTYLRDLRASDLAGSAGMYRLREELLARANKSLAPAKVNNILFTDILIQ